MIMELLVVLCEVGCYWVTDGLYVGCGWAKKLVLHWVEFFKKLRFNSPHKFLVLYKFFLLLQGKCVIAKKICNPKILSLIIVHISYS